MEVRIGTATPHEITRPTSIAIPTDNPTRCPAPRSASDHATLYPLEGAAGLPVFAQGHGGALWLIGPTAGYLLSYPFAAFVAGWFSQRGWGGTMVLVLIKAPVRSR